MTKETDNNFTLPRFSVRPQTKHVSPDTRKPTRCAEAGRQDLRSEDDLHGPRVQRHAAAGRLVQGEGAAGRGESGGEYGGGGGGRQGRRAVPGQGKYIHK
jgi:hypothetical protein